MDNNKKNQLDRYSMMIVSKYFRNIGDFIKMIKICKKFEEIPEMFHYNPVRLNKKIILFPNIETYHVYNKKELIISGYDKYVYWYQVTYDTYLKKKENEEFKKVIFSSSDWEKYKSFEGANILSQNAMTHCNLSEIDLSGITRIENRCFKGNVDVKYVKFDKRISTVPEGCFARCSSIVELDLSHIKTLGNSCFDECVLLTAITLPEMLYEIDSYCFHGLNKIEKIETKGVKLIKTNMSYSLYDSFKRNGLDVKGDISYNCYDRNKYGNEIPEGVSSIESYTFYSVTTIGDVVLPKSVTKLETYCYNYCPIKSIDLSNVVRNSCSFEGCNELTSITLNKNIIDSVESLGINTFYNRLTKLKNIGLSDTNHIPIVSNHLRKLMSEKGYRYDNCIYTREDSIETDSIVPEEVNTVGNYVFYSSNGHKTIIIPSNVTHLLLSNFFSMSDIEHIEIQSANLQCEGNCFSYLPNIKELDLSRISSFGSNCICDCYSLTKVIIQNIPLGNGFVGCNSLKEIEIIGIEKNQYEYPIDYKVAQLLENKGIHCKTKVFYRYGTDLKKETYSIPDGVNEIATNAFQYGVLKQITIPSSVTMINSYSFYYCSFLTNVIFLSNPEIQKNAFYGCQQLFNNQPDLNK